MNIKERLRKHKVKLSTLNSLYDVARKKKIKKEGELIKLLREIHRTSTALKAESFALERIPEGYTPNIYLEMVARGEIGWDDEPWDLAEYRTLKEGEQNGKQARR